MNKKFDIIYGIRAVIESLDSGQHFERIFIQKNLKGDLYKELMLKVHQSDTPISKVPVERLHRFTRKIHQGVVALISPISYQKLENLVPYIYEQGENPLFIILDGITDVRNFGAIARSAECMGVHGIIIPLAGAAQINEDSMKTSAGAFNYIPVCRQRSLLDAVTYLQESGINVIGCTEKSEQDISKLNFTLPTAIIMGAEESGISDALLERANDLAKIPMKGHIQSLNVSVAAGMTLYEAFSQRQ